MLIRGPFYGLSLVSKEADDSEAGALIFEARAYCTWIVHGKAELALAVTKIRVIVGREGGLQDQLHAFFAVVKGDEEDCATGRRVFVHHSEALGPHALAVTMMCVRVHVRELQ